MRYKWGVAQQHVVTMRHCVALLSETDCRSCDRAHDVKRWKNRKRHIITHTPWKKTLWRLSGPKAVSQRSTSTCYGTAPCLISSHLINHASSILSNELTNTSVWLLWNSSLFNLLHCIIVWSCGHYYIVWQLLGITPHCWLNAKPLLYTAYTHLILIQSNYILTQLFPYMFFLSHIIFLSLTYLIAGSYPIGGYLDHILLNDKPGLV